MAGTMQSTGWTIALDGGTTNTRARLLDGHRIVATARRAMGVRDAVIGRPVITLAEAIRECLEELRPVAGGAEFACIVAAGMLTAEVGLCAVPHVVAPAGLEELASGVVERVFPEIAPRAIELIPGVRTPPGAGPDGWAAADVMRGEECETLGALCMLDERGMLQPGEQVFLWPGSHTKLVLVDRAGRIASSFTTLAGEMLAALSKHTLLAASLPETWPEAIDDEAYVSGYRLASEQGLGRAAFLVRIAALAARFDAGQRASFWLGALIAHDVDCLVPHLPGAPVWIGGRSGLRAQYAAALSERGAGPVRALDDDLAEAASALGALAIIERRRGTGLA